MNTIGERIKFLRKSMNLTVEQLADLINKKKGNISSYENNKYEPSAQTIIDLCKVFKVSADWLLTGEDHNKISENYVSISEQSEFNNSLALVAESYSSGTQEPIVSDNLKLTNRELNLLNAYRCLEDSDKDVVEGTIDLLLKRLEKSLISDSYIPGEEDVATLTEETPGYYSKKHA